MQVETFEQNYVAASKRNLMDEVNQELDSDGELDRINMLIIDGGGMKVRYIIYVQLLAFNIFNDICKSF